MGMVDLNSIVSALRHRKIAAALIIAEIAVAFAILSNALFLIGTQIAQMRVASGTAEKQLLVLYVAAIPGTDAASADAVTRGDLGTLAKIAGVKSVSALSQVPYGDTENVGGIDLKPDQTDSTVGTGMYTGDEATLETLGVRLIAGRGFRADEVASVTPGAMPPIAILTRALAERLFGESNALGKFIYLPLSSGKKAPVRVIGVVERLVRPYLFGRDTTPQTFSMIIPGRLSFVPATYYVIRTSSADMSRVEREAKEALAKTNRALKIQWAGPMTVLKTEHFRQERSMTWTLLAVCLALLIVTAAGIFGLTSVWMRERVHQIGIRRALGATRGQILVHYMLENFPLAVGGVLLGSALAFATSSFLLAHGYSSSRLPLLYVAVGAAILLGLNQLAVFTPARRAATIAPAEATRL